jgi:hypothetical protein
MSARRTLLALLGVSLLALCVPVHASSISTYNYTTALSGGYGTATGTFTYNSTTSQFVSASISFVSSIFGNVTLSSATPQTGILSLYGGTVNGNSILYTILLNPLNLGQYWINGGIGNNLKISGFQYSATVPEGGTLSYALCSVTMLAAICVRRKAGSRFH